ncbi:MAG: hypothetical protein EYC70_11995 [Planctomycetota bacterium]|nr:MAG: hypothetical protein EYC70_11995 [Planctomycetota bacterium]
MARHDSRSLRRVDPGFATLALGGATMVFGLIGFVYPLRIFRAVDIPITGLLYIAVAWITLASRGRREQAFAGLLLASLGFAVPLLAFLLDLQHPWRG